MAGEVDFAYCVVVMLRDFLPLHVGLDSLVSSLASDLNLLIGRGIEPGSIWPTS